jgi:hypothetical protein
MSIVWGNVYTDVNIDQTVARTSTSRIKPRDTVTTLGVYKGAGSG